MLESTNTKLQTMLSNLGLEFNAASHLINLHANFVAGNVSKMEYLTRLRNCREAHRTMGLSHSSSTDAIFSVIDEMRQNV